MEDFVTKLTWLGLMQLLMVALTIVNVILEYQKNRKSEYIFFAVGLAALFVHLVLRILFAGPINLADEFKPVSPQIQLAQGTAAVDAASGQAIHNANHVFWLILENAAFLAGMLLIAYSLVLPLLLTPASDEMAGFLKIATMACIFLCAVTLLIYGVYIKTPFQWGVGALMLHLAGLAIISYTLFVLSLQVQKGMMFLKLALGMFLFAKLSVIANCAVAGREHVLLFSEYGFEAFSYLLLVMAVNQISSEDLRVLFEKLKSRTNMLEDATKRLAKLNQLSTDLLQTTDIESLRAQILNSITITMGFKHAFILLLDQKEKFLRGWQINETTGRPINFANIRLSSDSFLVDAFYKGKVLFFGEGSRMPDAGFMQNYQYSKNLVTLPLMAKKETFCWELHDCDNTRCPIRTWSLPVCWHAKQECRYYTPEQATDLEICLDCPAFNIIGLLVIDNRSSTLRIDEKNLPFIETFANQAGIALHNATLMDNLEAEVNFREITFKNLPTGLTVIDHQGLIATVNPAQEKILRQKSEDLAGRPYRAVRLVNDMPLLIEIINSTLNGGGGYEDFSKVWDLTLPDTIMKLNVRVSPLPKTEDSGGGVLVLTENITDKLELEKQLLHSEKLATIGQMAAGIAHEVNNPLAGVSGFLQVMSARLDPSSPDKPPILAALKNIERASNTIKDLLKFARPAPSEKKLSDVNQSIQDSLLFLSYQPRHGKVQVIRDLQDDLPDIFADPGQISQVLDNMIINALDAMDGEGTLRITTGLSGRWVHIYITDTGPGIPPANISRVFDPFFTTKGSGKGTGLGLSTCDRVVNEHGGTIAVYSVPGKETTFLIRLPVAEQEMARYKRKRMFESKKDETDDGKGALSQEQVKNVTSEDIVQE